jgi:Ca2+-transporting ATPase
MEIYRPMSKTKQIEKMVYEKEVEVSWHSLNANEVLAQLDTPIETGLSTAEVKARQEKYGLNELVEKKKITFWQMLWSQLNNFIVILLIVASVISAVLGDYIEASAIMLIVILNAILGIVQESRAENALAALKKLAAPEAKVLRDGQRISVPAPQLVPGDVVFIEAGNFIPADLRLLEAVNLSIEEASLTGESVPVTKHAEGNLQADIPLGDRKNTAFMGTLVTYGRGKGIVTSTGMHTQLGLIATMLQAVEEEATPLMKRLEQLGKVLGYGALAVCGLVFVIVAARLFIGHPDVKLTDPRTIDEIVKAFMIAVSLAIAAVPEGLAAVVTISLAGGMREMVRRHALIRRLSSVETLGSVTTICSDKTGTLTQNEMTVTRLWVDGNFITVTGSGYEPEGDFLVDGKKVNLNNYSAAKTALWLGTLNNDAQLELSGEADGKATYRMVGDPTEGSILVAALKAGASAKDLNMAFPRKQEIPFDSDRKRMVTIHEIETPKTHDISPFDDKEKRQWFTVAVKGAPDVVLGLCSHFQALNNGDVVLDDKRRKQVLDANDLMTKEALRVLGVAYRLVPALPTEIKSEVLEKDLIFVGLIGMIDPARKEVKPALAEAAIAGIRTIMITGDYPNTAKAIAEEIGLLRKGHQVMTGAEINNLTDEEMIEVAKVTDVYARVSPEHKMRIVDALRANDEIVAMTGDGVNDAPAIKRSDIGISMGITGTDVAKETADMVLTDDNYASIVSAVEQGRVIYSNIRKFVYYLLSCNAAEIMVIFLAALFGWPVPLTAIQLLWLNLVTDGAPALALGAEKGDPDIMLQKPRPPKEPIINKFMQLGILVQTIAITAATLGAFYIGLLADLQAAGVGHMDTFRELLSFDWSSINITIAESMAFVTLSISELLRAFTARSEYYPLLKIGPFKNKFMNWAVLASLALILLVIYVPFLQGVFNTHSLTLVEWVEMLPLILLPSVTAEVMKTITFKRRDKELAKEKAARE